MMKSKTAALAGVLLCLLSTSARAAESVQVAPPEVEVAKPAEVDSLDRNLAVFFDVLGLVRNAYVDEPGSGLIAGAMESFTDALDPFSTYVPAAEIDSYLEARKVGWLHSGVLILKERGIAYVLAVQMKGPAGLAGVQQGDIVASVNNRSTRLMPSWEIQKMFAGKPGTKLDLELVRMGEARKVSMILSQFTSRPPSLSNVRQSPILRIPTFDATTATEVKKLLIDSAETTKQGLLLDLRGVPTGDPEAAYATAELFADGELGTLTHRSEQLQVFQGDAAPVWQGRLVVLVDRATLGAAEILATVLRQKADAELIGENTFGYAGKLGSVDLSSGGRLFFTEAFYTGPDRKLIREALVPDIVIDERSRTSKERDMPKSELILDRGVRHLLGEKGEQQ